MQIEGVGAGVGGMISTKACSLWEGSDGFELIIYFFHSHDKFDSFLGF